MAPSLSEPTTAPAAKRVFGARHLQSIIAPSFRYKLRRVTVRLMLAVLRKFEHNRVFTPDEAWLLFRIAAIAEACGWTMLVSGIAIGRYILPGNTVPVLLAGRVHGMLFLLYALAAAGLYPSLRWSRWRALVALAASVPPYGSLMFEQWARHQRDQSQFKTYRCCIVLAALSEKL
jgi:integral membrane protein